MFGATFLSVPLRPSPSLRLSSSLSLSPAYLGPHAPPRQLPKGARQRLLLFFHLPPPIGFWFFRLPVETLCRLFLSRDSLVPSSETTITARLTRLKQKDISPPPSSLLFCLLEHRFKPLQFPASQERTSISHPVALKSSPGISKQSVASPPPRHACDPLSKDVAASRNERINCLRPRRTIHPTPSERRKLLSSS